MHKLTKEQRSVENAKEFISKFSDLHLAGVGVILVRTREPKRAMDSLRDFANAEKNLNYKTWSVVYGWTTFCKEDPSKEPVRDDLIDLGAAIQLIQTDFEDGIYTILYPHLANLNRNSVCIGLLKEYSFLFSEELRRIVLIVPPTYELPIELEDDIIILDFLSPSYGELIKIYNKSLSSIPVRKNPKFKKAAIDRIISVGSGMTEFEFETSLSRAWVQNSEALPKISVDKILDVLSSCKVEVINKTDVLEMMDPIGMSSVGGLQPLKEWLQLRVASFSDEAKNFGISPPRGITLVGPPGTGKSLVAMATSDMLALPLIRFDVSRVFQSLVGSSEARIRNTLAIVDSMAPICLLLDELDKVFGGTVSGLQGDSGVGQRILGSILTWLQTGTAPVFVIATANRIEYLPPEMMRRGRMDEVFSVQMPSEQERLEILRIHLDKRGHDPDLVEGLNEAASSSNGYVGAELEAAIKDALIESWAIAQKTGSKPMITGMLIKKQLEELKPLSQAFPEQFKAMAEWAANNARPANSSVADLPSPQARTQAGALHSRRLGGMDG